MRKETKFNYGLLLFGAGMPPVMDALFGPKWGLAALVIIACLGLGLLISGHFHKEQDEVETLRKRRARFALLGGIAALAIMGVRWSIRRGQQSAGVDPGPLMVPRAHLHIDSYEFLKMRPGKPVAINIFYRNDGEAEMTDEHIFALIARTAPASAPEQEKDVEDYLWKTFSAAPRQPVLTKHVLPAHSLGVWSTMYGEPLTARQIRTVESGRSTVWFMGYAAYTDSIGEQTTSFCVYYNGDPKVVFLCSEHNRDAQTH